MPPQVRASALNVFVSDPASLRWQDHHDEGVSELRAGYLWKAPAAGAIGMMLLAFPLSGCSTVVHLDPAPEANSEACANVTVRLPGEVGGFRSQDTDAQATSAWGNPVSVFLRCGVPSPTVSVLRCITLESIDWLIDTSNSKYVVATTYGRTPATQVIMAKDVPPGTILGELAPAVSHLPPSRRHCL